MRCENCYFMRCSVDKQSSWAYIYRVNVCLVQNKTFYRSDVAPLCGQMQWCAFVLLNEVEKNNSVAVEQRDVW